MFSKTWVTANFWWKLASLILATIVWLTFKTQDDLSDALIRMESNREFVTVPVMIMKTPGDKRNFELDPGVVDITVRGESLFLRNLTPKDIQAFVDIASWEPTNGGKVEVFLSRGARVERVLPTTINVQVTK